MKVNEHDLRRLYAEHIKAQIPLSRLHCPSFDRLVSFFEGRFPKRTKRALINHVTSCASCYQEFIFLSQLRKYENDLAQHLTRTPEVICRGASPLSFVYHQLTAFIIFGLLLSVAFLFWRGIPQADQRGNPSLNMILEQPSGRSALIIPFVFRWRDKISNREYVIELFDDSLRPLWKSNRVVGTSVSLSPEKVGLIIPRRSYFWMVTAYTTGSSIVESDLQEFIVDKR